MTGDTQTLDPGEISVARQCSIIVKQLRLTSISVSMSLSDEARVSNHLNMMRKDTIIKLFIEAWKHVGASQKQVKSLVRSEREVSGKLFSRRLNCTAGVTSLQ